MVVDTKLYDIIGVKPNATQSEIRKAFVEKAKRIHPDKNRNDPKATEKFQELNNAYDILKDPQKRKRYDDVGIAKTNLNQSQSQTKRIRRTKNIVHNLNVTLEDLYKGKETTLKINRDVICPKCQGNGCKKGKHPQKCRYCDGTGQIIKIIKCCSACPGIWKEVAICSACNGIGEIVEPKDQCQICNGKGTVPGEKIIKVIIDAGMEDDDKIIFNGLSDEKKGFLPGDLIIVLKMDYHTSFMRKHNNLLIRKAINLSEAIIGLSFIVDHLDGRKLLIETPKNQIIENDSMIVIEGEGMPKRGNWFEKGNLYVQFHICFPFNTSISEKLREELVKCIPIWSRIKETDLNDENIHKVDIKKAGLFDFDHSKPTYDKCNNDNYDRTDENESTCEPM